MVCGRAEHVAGGEIELGRAAVTGHQEICGLKWRDLLGRGTAGQGTVFGNGGKTPRCPALPEHMEGSLGDREGSPGRCSRVPITPRWTPRSVGDLTSTLVHRVKLREMAEFRRRVRELRAAPDREVVICRYGKASAIHPTSHEKLLSRVVISEGSIT